MGLRTMSPLNKCFLGLICAALVLFTAQPAAAQVLYGSIVGQVLDATGGAVPGATVSVTNTATGQTSETKTDEGGRYAIPNLQAGPYEVRVTSTGFKAATRPTVEVTINTVSRVDMTLEVGQVSEQVTVAASGVLLQTEKSDVHTEIGTTAITNLPLSRYRNYQALIDLVPGATPARTQNAQTDTPARSLTTNVNGTARNNNNTKLDGASNVFIWLPHHSNYVAPAETVETVNVTTNSFDAEQGMAGGAAITVITKSGTNELHGSAFWYHDNQHLRARNFFLPATQDKPRNTTNITGGTLGGPIVKNRVFFFGGWEGFRERAARTGFLTVPTADVRQGNFSQYMDPSQPGLNVIYDPTTGDAEGRNRTPFANNTIPQSRISPIAQRALQFIPLPNLPGTVNNYFASGTERMNRDNFDIKVDFNRSQSHRIWTKYSAMDAQVTCPYALGEGGANLPGCSSSIGDTLVQLATIGNTWTISPTFLFDGTLGWTRLGQNVVGADFGTNIGSEVLGIPGTNGPDIRQSGFPAFNFTQYSSFGNTNGWTPMYRNDQSYTGTANFNWIKGAHNLRFGYEGVRHWLNHWQPELGSGPRGALTFGGGVTALNAPGAAAPGQYNSYAAFLLGSPSSFGKSVQLIKMTAFEWQHGLYFRDRWQATQNLTLNLGVRWEYYPLMTRANGGIERYDAETNIVYVGGYGDVPKNAGVTTSKRLFAPRVGLAYRLGDTTVVRAGYGITFNPMPLARPLRGFYPLTVGSDFTAPNGFAPVGTLVGGIPEICCPDLSTGQVQLPPAALMRTPFEGELKRGYIQSWNTFVEQRLPADFVVAAGYVGTRTIRQFADLNINAAAPGTGNAGRPLNQRFGRIADTLLWQGWLDADYHALQTSINRHFANGFFLKGAYTWSKAINYTDDDGWAGLPLTNWGPALERNRARAGYDRPHIFQLAAIYELPFGQGRRFATEGVAAAIAGGWQLNGQFSAYSGTPFTVTAPGSALNAPGSTQTADQVKPEVEKLGGIGLGNPYYDPTAFAAPTDPGRFGTTGRNILRGPGATGLDLGLFRTFRITEQFNLQFRADAFNVTNTPIFANPSADVGVPGSFMSVTSTANDAGRYTERQFRFGLRLGF